LDLTLHSQIKAANVLSEHRSTAPIHFYIDNAS